MYLLPQFSIFFQKFFFVAFLDKISRKINVLIFYFWVPSYFNFWSNQKVYTFYKICALMLICIAFDFVQLFVNFPIFYFALKPTTIIRAQTKTISDLLWAVAPKSDKLILSIIYIRVGFYPSKISFSQRWLKPHKKLAHVLPILPTSGLN